MRTRGSFSRELQPTTLASVQAATLDDPTNWDGGFYGLALEFEEGSTEPLDTALRASWDSAGIKGCYCIVGAEGHHEPASCDLETLLRVGQLRGLAAIPGGKMLPLGVVATRERESVAPPFDAPDWLFLFLPLGALEKSDPRVGGYPFGDFGNALEWRRPIDEWFERIGRRVHEVAPFRLGLIGMEVAGEAYSERLQGRVPPERSFGFLIPDRSGRVDYFPATE